MYVHLPIGMKTLSTQTDERPVICSVDIRRTWCRKWNPTSSSLLKKPSAFYSVLFLSFTSVTLKTVTVQCNHLNGSSSRIICHSCSKLALVSQITDVAAQTTTTQCYCLTLRWVSHVGLYCQVTCYKQLVELPVLSLFLPHKQALSNSANVI